MFKWEKKAWNWIQDHLILFLFVLSTLLSLIIRWSMKDFISDDMSAYLLPWFEEIRDGGGFLALGTPVGNYNMPYQTLIALLTYLPVAPQVLYKLASSVFDFFQAWLLYKLVLQLTGKKPLAAVIYAVAVNLPVVLLNSALWGQCDSIYTSFCLLSLYFCLKEKYTGSFIAAGLAFAFKLQAVFFLPFLFFLYVYKKKFSFIQFLWIPLMMILLSLPAILQGQPLKSVFTIYYNQTTYYNCMSYNYPSFWAMFIENFREGYYFDLHWFAILLALLALLVLIIVFLRERREYDAAGLLLLAFLFAYTCVFFLPSMHERYGYLYVILGLAAVTREKKLLPSYLLLVMIDLMIYGPFLFKYNPSWQLLAALNTLCYGYTVYVVCRRLLRSETSAAAV